MPPPPPEEGPGGPILVIGYSGNPFSRYYAEILRAEGLNAFKAMDISAVDATVLAQYDVAILGEMPLTASQVTMLSDWVNGGGNLIAMRPASQLATLLGLTSSGTTLAQGYLAVDTSRAPGLGIVGQTIQFHGTADRYTLAAATPRRGRRRDTLLECDHGHDESRGHAPLRGHFGRRSGRVHVRSRAVDRLHAPGQPGVGG